MQYGRKLAKALGRGSSATYQRSVADTSRALGVFASEGDGISFALTGLLQRAGKRTLGTESNPVPPSLPDVLPYRNHCRSLFFSQVGVVNPAPGVVLYLVPFRRPTDTVAVTAFIGCIIEEHVQASSLGERNIAHFRKLQSSIPLNHLQADEEESEQQQT